MRVAIWLANVLFAAFAMQAEAFDLGGLVKQVEAGIGGQVPSVVTPRSASASTTPTASGFQQEKQEADRLSEKMFLSSSEYCERVANNPSVKAYASLFEKLNTESQALELARKNRDYYRNVRLQYLDSNDLLKNWVAGQIKAEGVPSYVEHILTAKAIQLANECANQHVNDTLYFFFDPTGVKRNQDGAGEKEVLDANGNLVKQASGKSASVLLANYTRVDERYLKGLRINVANTADTQAVSLWALALRNSDNAIKNAAQDRLTSELGIVDQWVLAQQTSNEQEKKEKSSQLTATLDARTRDGGAFDPNALKREREQQADQKREEQDQARRDKWAKEEADSKAKKLVDMQAGYELRKRRELEGSFNSCLKNEKAFETGYVALLESLAQQSATVSQRDDLQKRAADWKKNIGSTVSAMCLSRMKTALLSVASSDRMSMAEIAANTTETGFELVKPILAMKPSVFYVLINAMGALNEGAIHSPELKRAREEIERQDGRPNYNEAYAAFENQARANADLVTSFMSGKIH